MGVDVSTHLFYGIKLDLDTFEKEIKDKFPDFADGEEFGYYEFLEAEVDGTKEAEFDVIVDHMSGEYILFGKEIAQTGEHDEKFYEVSPDHLPDRDTLIAKINARLKSEYLTSDFKLLFFNHFW